jgi:hypothetical protein
MPTTTPTRETPSAVVTPARTDGAQMIRHLVTELLLGLAVGIGAVIGFTAAITVLALLV